MELSKIITGEEKQKENKRIFHNLAIFNYLTSRERTIKLTNKLTSLTSN